MWVYRTLPVVQKDSCKHIFPLVASMDSEICLGDKRKQLEFLKSVWKSTNAPSAKPTPDLSDPVGKSHGWPEIEPTDAKKTSQRKTSNKYTFSPEWQLEFSDSEDDWGSFRHALPRTSPTHEDDGADHVIYNNLYEVPESKSSRAGPKFIAILNLTPQEDEADTGRSRSSQGSSEKLNISDRLSAGTGSMFTISMGYKHADKGRIKNSDIPNIPYRNNKESMGFGNNDISLPSICIVFNKTKTV